ncbi:unnamed protein product [Lepidochelys olivacea]
MGNWPKHHQKSLGQLKYKGVAALPTLHTWNSTHRGACVCSYLETTTHIHQPGDTDLASFIPTHSPARPHLRKGIRLFSAAPVRPAVQPLPWAVGEQPFQQEAERLGGCRRREAPITPASPQQLRAIGSRPGRAGARCPGLARRRQRGRSHPTDWGRAPPGCDCDTAGGAARGPAAPAQRRAAMERQEQAGPAGAAEPGESPDAQFQAVVQRTQVLLLAGETWEADRARAALSSFAHEVLPVARRSASPAPPSAPPAGQLVFFLCRAPSLRGRAERLREVLRGVREQSRGAPAALVGVIVQPRPEEEAEARRRLEELLLEVFQPPASGPGAAPRVEVHTAVFRPGRPEGALEVKKAACEALREEPEDAVWVSRATLFKALGALCVACAGIIGSQYMNTRT